MDFCASGGLAPDERKRLLVQKCLELGELSHLEAQLAKFGLLDVPGLRQRLDELSAATLRSVEYFRTEPPSHEVVAEQVSKSVCGMLTPWLKGITTHPKDGRSFTNAELAKLFKTHANTVSNWINGNSPAPEGFSQAYADDDMAALIESAKKYVNRRKERNVWKQTMLDGNLSDEQLEQLRMK